MEEDSVLGKVWAEQQRGQPKIENLASDRGIFIYVFS